MLKSKYLVRLDDACPTMDHKQWNKVLAILDRYGIKPVVGVVPDNQDPLNVKAEPDQSFWDRVRSWQSKGYTIAMHGYQHVYETQNSGIVAFNKRSEFAGLSAEKQRQKIVKAWDIFKKNKILPTVWIAPGHSFDEQTLQGLRANTDIKIVSDGIAFDVYYEKGFYWIPQQLWAFRSRSWGLYTVCLHPNYMSDNDISELEKSIIKYKEDIVELAAIDLKKRQKSSLEKLYGYYFILKRKWLG